VAPVPERTPPGPRDPRATSEGSDAADAARAARLLVVCVGIGFVLGICVLVFAVWLDWT
jgi:hypothetical protein